MSIGLNSRIPKPTYLFSGRHLKSSKEVIRIHPAYIFTSLVN